MVVYFAIFRHTQRREQRFLSDLTAALGLMMILGQVAVLFFGSAPKSIPPAFPGKLSVIGATITYERLIVILLGIAMTVVLALFLQRTNLGRALRTVAVNTDIAALLGVNWNRVYLVTMAVGCALAGLAGGLIAPLFPIAQTMGGIILVVLLVVLFGGMGSMLGVSLGALIFGLSQSYGQAFIGTGVAQIVVYVVVAGVIFFRPGGVFGKAGLDTTFT